MSHRTPDAIRYYEKAIQLDAEYDIPYNNLGVIYLDTMGDVSKAMDLFQQAIQLNENYALAYYNLGRSYSFLGNKLEAASYFRQAQQTNKMTRELDNAELEERIFKLFNATPD